jgi:fatty-acid desaturase
MKDYQDIFAKVKARWVFILSWAITIMAITANGHRCCDKEKNNAIL